MFAVFVDNTIDKNIPFLFQTMLMNVQVFHVEMKDHVLMEWIALSAIVLPGLQVLSAKVNVLLLKINWALICVCLKSKSIWLG